MSSIYNHTHFNCTNKCICTCCNHWVLFGLLSTNEKQKLIKIIQILRIYYGFVMFYLPNGIWYYTILQQSLVLLAGKLIKISKQIYLVKK